MKFLIIYGTSEGQTRKISRFMEEVLEDAGHKATIADATEEPPSPEKYDVVIIGSSVHMGKYHSAIKDYIIKNKDLLNQKSSAFFSVSMAIASKIDKEHKEVEEIAEKFLHNIQWQPNAIWHIAGALKYTQYDYFKKLVMRMIAKGEGGETDTTHDYEYTDWDAVKESVLEFVADQ